MAAFDITENAFALLQTTPRANRNQLDDAYQDALLEAEDHSAEAILHRAHQLLISPRERLECELGYFVDTKPATTKAIFASLRRQDQNIPTSELAGIDLINLSAHLCGVGNPQQRLEHALTLINAYDDLDLNGISESLNAVRSVSGFGSVDDSQIRSALVQMRQSHTRAALDAILEVDDGVDHLSELAEGLIDAGTVKRSFLEALLQTYESRIGPDLEHAAIKVREGLDAVAADPEDQQLMTVLATNLRAWDRLAQPLQNADRARGIDEHHSQELFAEIREVCLSLANEQGLYSQALAISKLAAEIFSELPDTAEKLETDIGTLANLSSQKDKAELLVSLRNAVSIANVRHSETCACLRKFGFSANAQPPVLEIHSSFVSLLNKSNDPELNGMGAALVRNLSLDLCNKSGDSHAALAIVEGLLKHRSSLPVDVIKALEGDCKTLQGNIDFIAMTEAIKLGRLDEADRLAEGMLGSADEEARGVLLGVRSSIVERKKTKKRKLIGWILAAAVILGMIIANDGTNSGSSYDTSDDTAYEYTDYQDKANDDRSIDTASDYPYYQVESALTDEAANAASAAAEAADSAALEAAAAEPYAVGTSSFREETPPAPYQTYRTVTLSELRYCKRQKARLESLVYEPLSDLQIERFNMAVDDYNSRCESFRYNQSDMDIVDREMALDQSSIHSEAQDIIGSW